MKQLKYERIDKGVTVDIYGLYDPDTGELRYIGKGKHAQTRLTTHLSDAKRSRRPVCLWIQSLVSQGKAPTLKVLEIVADDEWKAAERRLIAQHRQTSDLLNLAPGGDMPTATREQCSRAAKAANAAMAKADPKLRALWRAKQAFARHATQTKKEGDIFEYYCMRFRMRAFALQRPDLYASWLGEIT